MNEAAAIRSELDNAARMVSAENYPQAELYLRRYLRFGGKDPAARHLLSAVHQGFGVPEPFELVEAKAPLATAKPKYLLIKAWGCGFWSDVHHVIGQLLLAELTQRVPVVQWGDNSLFGAWDLFFEPVADAVLPVLDANVGIFPAKWNTANLGENNVNKWDGADSRIAAPQLFCRDEDIVVSDFYMTVSSLIPWIGRDSRYHGLSDDEIYLDLFARHLRPRAGVIARVDAFHRAHMQHRPQVAVHVRGSDKVFESTELHRTNERYFGFVDRIILLNPGIGVFLLTDSVDVHASFEARYGDLLVATPALRSSSERGVHMQGHAGQTVAEEVMVDAYLAARCHYFIGNQESNVSLAIASLKRWPPGFLALLGDKNGRAENLFLHRPKQGDAAPACRLCASPVGFAFDALVLGKHRVRYAACSSCGALQTETPHWLAEAYSGAAERFDTGKASRTVVNFLALPRLLEILHVRPGDMAIDFGGGTGLFARLMRDLGHNFHSFDKFGSGEFTGAFNLTGIEQSRCSLMTLFEVAEHFAEPAEEWARIFATDPDFVIGSTGLYEGQGPQWPYLSPESGQHVFFYSFKALEHIARQHGRVAYRAGMYFLIARRPLSAEQMEAIRGWSAGLYPACKQSFDQWAQGPYTHATRDNRELAVMDSLRQSGTRIVLDGVFFRFSSGIARLWRSVLAEWSASGFGEFVVVIDRARTAPRLPGIRYVDAPQHQYADIAADRRLLQDICDRERASLFISTYYSSPLTTPAVLMVLDMIPEVMGFDLADPQWVEKRRCIEYAEAYLAISDSTARDLVRFHPQVPAASVQTTYCGSDFRTALADEVSAFRARHGITRPWFLIAGGRADYKNAALFFKAFEQLGDARAGLAVVCTHAVQLEPEFAACLGPAQVHTLVLSDADLQCAYSGGVALAYPSRYEGFGLPVLEAMACSCPVITCASSSIPEVGGDAVLYVGPDDVAAMQAALIKVQDAATRADLIARGLARARRFSWTRMARDVALALATRAVEHSGARA